MLILKAQSGTMAGDSANINPTTGLFEYLNPTTNSCPPGEFMVGVHLTQDPISDDIYVDQILCQRL